MSTIHKSGTRKRATARATLRAGTGVIRINSQRLDTYTPALLQQRILEPLILAGDSARKVNIDVRVTGGGTNGQADACRVAICRALVEHDQSLEKTFLEYDRGLLVPDVRQNEPAKPRRHGKARAKRQKSYR